MTTIFTMLLLTVLLAVTPVDAKTVKKPKLNATKVTLTVGKKKKLKVKNRKGKKVTWKSTNKKVATVNKKGVVRAKKAGKATIIAKVGKRKLKCKIKVKKPTKKKNTKKDSTKKDSTKKDTSEKNTEKDSESTEITDASVTATRKALASYINKHGEKSYEPNDHSIATSNGSQKITLYTLEQGEYDMTFSLSDGNNRTAFDVKFDGRDIDIRTYIHPDSEKYYVVKYEIQSDYTRTTDLLGEIDTIDKGTEGTYECVFYRESKNDLSDDEYACFVEESQNEVNDFLDFLDGYLEKTIGSSIQQFGFESYK